MADVFISYSKKDRDLALRVETALSSEGLSVWWDDNLSPGQSWDRIIEKELAKAKVTMVLWTPRSVSSEFVRSEVNYAKSKDKLIPAMLEECEVPLAFSLTQYADLSLWSGDSQHEEWRRLVRLLREAINKKPRHRAEEFDKRFAPQSFGNQFNPSISSHYARTNKIVETLTNDQVSVLKLLGRTRRVLIKGCAGSGKTLVACEKAIRCANAGMRTLFVCHNPHLAKFARGLVTGSGVEVYSFAEWLRYLTGETPIETNAAWSNLHEPDSEDIWAALDGIANYSGYDCIIVDEGQDFRADWWELLLESRSNPECTHFFIFSDDHQALLPHRAKPPITEPVINLSRNCRNAGRIFRLIKKVHPLAPDESAELRREGFVSHIELGHPIDWRTKLSEVMNVSEEKGLIVGKPTILITGGLEQEFPHQTTFVSQGERIETWQAFVRKQFEAVLHHYKKTAVAFSDDAEFDIRSILSQLSGEAHPIKRDTELISEATKFAAIDNVQLRKSIGARFADTYLELRVEAGRLGFTRRLGGAIHAFEVLSFFRDKNWARRLPPFKAWKENTSNDNPDIGQVKLSSIGSYKGLEAETVVLLAGNYAPISSADLYVAVSRARHSLVIADGTGSTVLAGMLEGSDFKLKHGRSDTLNFLTILDIYLDGKNKLTKLPTNPNKKLIAFEYIAQALEPGTEYAQIDALAKIKHRLTWDPDMEILSKIVAAGFLSYISNGKRVIRF